jgi:hypothetical protein
MYDGFRRVLSTLRCGPEGSWQIEEEETHLAILDLQGGATGLQACTKRPSLVGFSQGKSWIASIER